MYSQEINKYAVVYTPTLMDIGQRLLLQTTQNNEDNSNTTHMFQLTEDVACDGEQAEMFGSRLQADNTFSFKGIMFENFGSRKPCTVSVSQDCLKIKDSLGEVSAYRTQDFFVRERLSEKQYRMCSNERTFVISAEVNEKDQIQLLGALVNNFRVQKLPWQIRKSDYNPVYQLSFRSTNPYTFKFFEDKAMSANNNANKYKTTNIFLSLEGINGYAETLFSCRIGDNFELPVAVTGYILKVLVQGFQMVVGTVYPQNEQIV